MNLPSSQAVEADQSFVFFCLTFRVQSFTPEIKDGKDRKNSSFFVDGVLFFLLGYLCLMNSMDLQTSIMDDQELNYS